MCVYRRINRVVWVWCAGLYLYYSPVFLVCLFFGEGHPRDPFCVISHCVFELIALSCNKRKRGVKYLRVWYSPLCTCCCLCLFVLWEIPTPEDPNRTRHGWCECQLSRKSVSRSTGFCCTLSHQPWQLSDLRILKIYTWIISNCN